MTGRWPRSLQVRGEPSWLVGVVMHQRIFLVAATLALAGVAGGVNAQGLEYPETPRVDHVDVYHGVTVADPYRWLEDGNSDATRKWIEAQNAVTFRYLESIPRRDAIRKRLTELWNYERFGLPSNQRGGRYFFEYNDGLRNQPELRVTSDLGDNGRVLLDPNTLSLDGTVAVASVSITRDGRRILYGLSEAGSDWVTLRIRDVESGQDLPDVIRWVKFARPAWIPDGTGFFYSRYDSPGEGQALSGLNRNMKLYYHRVGDPQDMDRLVYSRDDRPDWGFHPEVADDGRTLVITVTEGTDRRNRVYFARLPGKWPRDGKMPRIKIRPLLDDFDASYGLVSGQGSTLWFHTDRDGGRGRVIAVDSRRAGPRHWKDVIPQSGDVLQTVDLVGDRFLAVYLSGPVSRVKVFEKDGTFRGDVALPGAGTVTGFKGHREDRVTFYSFESYTQPATIYRYDTDTGNSEVFRRPRLAFDSDRYESVLHQVKSRDGTMVPMLVTSRKGLQRTGNHPLLLYGYGGFNISVTPRFSPVYAAWLDMGGVLAVPNLRGGGELGEDWHLAGTKLRKQNTFDDFIAGAEYLIKEGFTRPDRLAIRGGSNGGLLVGAVVNQRPELFGAALPAVGVMDMLRFHRFTIGWAWVSDYGSSDDPGEFKVLSGYSPLHNLEPGKRYPATLVTTADHDDRVVPGHSFKYIAALQHAQAGEAPVLIRIETRAGHGAGKPTSKRIEEAADQWAFLVRVLGMKVESPGTEPPGTEPAQ